MLSGEAEGVNHLKHMVLGGAAIFGVLLVAGVPAGTAVTLALVLACPLMMVTMMAGGHHHTGRAPDQHGAAPGPESLDTPPERPARTER